jgi:O-antigen/teichoic acid export membrane protein
MRVINSLANSADKILLFHFLGAVPVALYSLAQLPITHLQNLLGLTKQLAFSKLAKTKLEDLKTSLPRKIRLFFIAAVALAIVYMLAAPFIFSLFFPAYIEAVRYSQVLALLILAVPRTLVIQTFLVHQMTKELYIIRISAPIVKLVLLGVLLPAYGIWGAVYALLVAELYMSTLQWFLLYRAKEPSSIQIP